MRPVEPFPTPPFSGNGLRRAEQAVGFAAGVLETAWAGSAEAVRWLAGRLRGGPGAAPRRRRRRWPEELRGKVLEEELLREKPYAASTLRRYGQIVERFRRWYEAQDEPGEDEGTVARYLAETSGRGAGRRRGGRVDARHLGLGRTTLSCIRSAVDRLSDRALALGTPLPPRPRRWAPVAREIVARLEQAAAAVAGEVLLLVLCVGVGLRVGQMATLRRRDIGRGCRRVEFAGRGGRRQVVAVPAECRWALGHCVRGLDPEAWLFPAGGGGGEAGPMSVRGLQRRLAGLVRRAGVPAGEVSFEALRRSGPGAEVRPQPADAGDEPGASGSLDGDPVHGLARPGPGRSELRLVVRRPGPAGMAERASGRGGGCGTAGPSGRCAGARGPP